MDTLSPSYKQVRASAKKSIRDFVLSDCLAIYSLVTPLENIERQIEYLEAQNSQCNYKDNELKIVLHQFLNLLDKIEIYLDDQHTNKPKETIEFANHLFMKMRNNRKIPHLVT